MAKIEFSITSSESPEKIRDILTDHSNLDKFFPPLVKTNVSKNNDEVILDQIISMQSKIIKMKSTLLPIANNEFLLKVLSGPLTNSATSISLIQKPNGTMINVKITLVVRFFYKIFNSIIEKKYKNLINTFINKISDAATLTTGTRWYDSVSENTLKLSTAVAKQCPIFHGWWYGDLKHMFLEKDYQILSIQDQTIVDVGANIGDSSIYFALNGAKKVIAIEAFPTNFQMLEKNIIDNKLSDTIIPLFGALSDKKSSLTIDSDASQGYTSFQLKEQKNGTRIQTITLANVLDRFEINDALLKLDCEGCEYNVILNSDTKTLLKFKTILIEFHNGFENIKNKLEISGFEIKQLISLKPTKGYLLAQKSNY